MAIDWSGLLNAGINLYAATRNANQNQASANQYAQQVKFNPYNIAAGNSGVIFNGNNAAAQLSPTYQNIQNQLTGGAGGLLGNIGSLYQNGGINPMLQGAFDTYNQQIGTNDIGDQFNAASKGFLGGLGSFDPNQAARDYSNNLRQQAAPGNQLAAENLAQGLFNTGRLGTTGGANVLGQLVQAQNQQDLQFQQAGRDYAGQEQNRLAGLASNFGNLGNQIINQRAQNRFQNAMSLFGAGQSNIQNQLSGGLGLLQGSQGLDQNLLQTIMTGGYLGGASSNANANAYNPAMQAGVAGNNANAAGLLGLLDSTGLMDKAGNWLGSLFGGGSGSNGLQNINVDLNAQSPQWWGISDPTFGNFSGAGGQAADTSGNGLMNNLFGGNYNFLNGLANIPNGMQDLSNVFGNSIQGMNDQQLANYLGSDPAIFNPDTFNSDSGSSGLLGQAGSAFGIYSGIKQGGAQGYAQAANSAAQLATGAGIPALGYVGAVDQAVHGDIPGAAISALSTAVPLVGFTFAAANLLNHAFTGHASQDRNSAAYEQATGAKYSHVNYGKTGFDFWALPQKDGTYKLIDNNMWKELAGNFYGAIVAPDGNQAGWQQKYNDSVNNLKESQVPKGYVFDSKTGTLTRG